MKKILLLTLFTMLFSDLVAQTSVCNAGGNLVIYSNYDGGYLNIDVDQNIPNLKIGVLTYEGVIVTISGAFASNVTKVWYAGANSNNVHCGAAISTSISGVAASVDTIEVFPAATLPDPNGDANMVCATGCSNANSGGCNTTNQVVDFFMTKLGTTNLLFHQTQYGCYLNLQTWKISSGGNCCLVPASIGINSFEKNEDDLIIYPNPTENNLKFKLSSISAYQIEICSIDGASILKKNILSPKFEIQEVSTEKLANGIYYFKVLVENAAYVKKFIVNK